MLTKWWMVLSILTLSPNKSDMKHSLPELASEFTLQILATFSFNSQQYQTCSNLAWLGIILRRIYVLC
ncbi:hypothetical protein AAHE18_17G156800 [Arachis hypogaea]